MRVQGRADGARGACDGGRQDTPIAAIATDPELVTITPKKDGTLDVTVRFTIEPPPLSEGEYPTEQECDIALTTPAGEPLDVEQVASTYGAAVPTDVEDSIRVAMSQLGLDHASAFEALRDATIEVVRRPFDGISP